MSVSCTSEKCEQESHQNQTESKKPRKEHTSIIAPEFWRNLSKVWLTRRALREFDRRNRQIRDLSQYSDSLTQPHLNLPVTEEHLDFISQVARNGGLDLTDLRGYHEPRQNVMEPNIHGPTFASSSQLTHTSTRTPYSGQSDRNFRQKLIDGGVFPYHHLFPRDSGRPKPGNFEDLRERRLRPRPSLSSTEFTVADFIAFEEKCILARNGKDIMKTVIPMLEGTTQGKSCRSSNDPFSNLRPLVDGIGCGIPEIYYGAKSIEVNPKVRRELQDLIIPSIHSDLPVAPNFFLQVKCHTGSWQIAEIEAQHIGALGERGQIGLRTWRQKESGLDNMAHTITSIFYDGYLRIFAVHAESSRYHEDRIDYYMNVIHSDSLDFDAKSFRKAATAYRNLRDYAEEQRNIAIAMANDVAQSTGDTVK